MDAPCSCSGVIRRSPWLRWELSEEVIQDYQSLQLEILDMADQALTAGTKLLYVTCSILPEENEEVIAKFMSKHPNYELAAYPDPITGKETKGLDTFFPPISEGDGMFIASLVKKG